MTAKTILAQIALGEDSTHQFKVDVLNGESLAAEMAAFANSGGGTLFIFDNRTTIMRNMENSSLRARCNGSVPRSRDTGKFLNEISL